MLPKLLLKFFGRANDLRKLSLFGTSATGLVASIFPPTFSTNSKKQRADIQSK